MRMAAPGTVTSDPDPFRLHSVCSRYTSIQIGPWRSTPCNMERRPKRRKAMKTVFFAFAMSSLMVAGAAAASITNKDAESQVLIVTEAGDKIEMVVEAGATVSFCPAGCFVTMPSGDRETLAGSESIEIVNGAAVIK